MNWNAEDGYFQHALAHDTALLSELDGIRFGSTRGRMALMHRHQQSGDPAHRFSRFWEFAAAIEPQEGAWQLRELP